MSKTFAAANDEDLPDDEGSPEAALPAGPRAMREAQRREAFMRTAAAVFRRQGLSSATMEQIAAAAGVTKMVLYRRFPSKEALIQAIFAEVIQRLNQGDARPWRGYGDGMRKSLAAARSFEDGYLLLVRQGAHHPAYQATYGALRRRGAQRLRGLLWYPNRPPPPAERPAMLHLTLEPMISFANDSLAYWLEQGRPADDELFLRWYGQMVQAWRRNVCELLNLDSPEQDWPFDTDGVMP